ncbi:hypothetical protein KY289_030058 [Solanum tuberosum]|nr:hypothetical protein KY289_030058 [Solanum tuberosum]
MINLYCGGSKLGVNKLHLGTNQFQGRIPQGVGKLSQLRILDVSSNRLGGLPEIMGQLSSLERFDASYNVLKDMLPSWFSDLPPELKILNLSYNHITGRVYEFIVRPATSLDLSRNQFSGEVPNCWMNMSNLSVLNLAYNNFSRKVPLSLGSLTNLEALYIRQNNFRGMLPSLSQCQLLQILDLGGNKFTGRIPAWIGTDLLKLHILSLRSNKFDGSIPSLICQLQFLQILDLSENGLSGKIPQCINNFTILRQENSTGESMDFQVRYDYIPGSYLYIGIPKEIAEMRGLRSLNLSRNDLNGTVVEGIVCWTCRTTTYQGEFHQALNCRVSTDHPIVAMLNSAVLLLKSVPDLLSLSIVEATPILKNMMRMMTMMRMRSSHHWSFIYHGARFLCHILGNFGLFDCQPFVEECLLHILNRHEELAPYDIKNLLCKTEGKAKELNNRLQILDLGGNKLTGRIPAWIGTDLLNLRILSLRYWTFQQMDYQGKFHIASTILPYYIRMIVLKNQESEYKNPLLYLMTIDLSSNELVGGIPKEIAEMRRLQSLNLSRNDLHGSVIEGIGQMNMLESLDLSRNKLSGVILQGFANLTFLSVLDLSNNHLSGRIPSSTQLQSFDRSSYNDNAQLCGPPLQECPGYAPPRSIMAASPIHKNMMMMRSSHIWSFIYQW